MPGGGPWAGRVLWSDGRLRVIWRLLVFVVLLIAGVVLGALLVPPPSSEVTSEALLWQGTVTLAAALAAGWIALAVLEGRPPGALGFALTPRVPRELAGGLAIGVAALGAVVVALLLVGALRYTGEPGTAGGWIVAAGTGMALLALPAAAEEAIFRGYGFQVLVEGLGPVAATALASGAFALAHGANPNVGAIGLVNIFLAGILLSVAYLRTRSLWFATAVHLGWNWSVGGLFDLPVSGLSLLDPPLYDAVLPGPAWLTGGAFGPEGGLAGTLGFGLALVAVWRWPRAAKEGAPAAEGEHGTETAEPSSSTGNGMNGTGEDRSG